MRGHIRVQNMAGVGLCPARFREIVHFGESHGSVIENQSLESTPTYVRVHLATVICYAILYARGKRKSLLDPTYSGRPCYEYQPRA